MKLQFILLLIFISSVFVGCKNTDATPTTTSPATKASCAASSDGPFEVTLGSDPNGVGLIGYQASCTSGWTENGTISPVGYLGTCAITDSTGTVQKFFWNSGNCADVSACSTKCAKYPIAGDTAVWTSL